MLAVSLAGVSVIGWHRGTLVQSWPVVGKDIPNMSILFCVWLPVTLEEDARASQKSNGLTAAFQVRMYYYHTMLVLDMYLVDEKKKRMIG